LVVGAERPEEFQYALDMMALGHDVTVVNPIETPASRAFQAAGGKFVKAGIETLPKGPGYDVMAEDFPVPIRGMFDSAREFATERISRLEPGGRWIVATEAPEFVQVLEIAGAAQGARVVSHEIPRFHEATPDSPHARDETRFIVTIDAPATRADADVPPARPGRRQPPIVEPEEFKGADKSSREGETLAGEPSGETAAKGPKRTTAREQAEIEEQRERISYRRTRHARRVAEGGALGFSRKEIYAARQAIVERKQISAVAEREHRGAEDHGVPDATVIATVNDPQAVLLSRNGNWIFYRQGTIVVTKAGKPDSIRTAFGSGGFVPQRHVADMQRLYPTDAEGQPITWRVGDAELPIKLDIWVSQQTEIPVFKVWP
jgi:hypothetical protein